MGFRSLTIIGAALALGIAAAGASAQEKASPPEGAKGDNAKGEPRSPLDRCAATTTARVQLVITRLLNEKTQASLPYTFVVPARPLSSCPVRKVSMRMGVETPVPVTTQAAPEGAKPTTSFQYKNVGTNIDCSAMDLGDGRYQLSLWVENSSALATPLGAATAAELSGVPVFRSFGASVEPILRDGQSVQTVASTDPVTGEVVKIDVSLNVLR